MLVGSRALYTAAAFRRVQEWAGARDMPIHPFLAGQAFEPELIRQMSLALESVCDTLELKLTDDPNTRLVAAKIIELAQRWRAGCGVWRRSCSLDE